MSMFSLEKILPPPFRACHNNFYFISPYFLNLPRSPHVHVLKTDYTVASLTSVLSSVHTDAVVSTLSGPALGAPQIALIDAAKAAGVKRFLPSEFGSDTTNEKLVELIELFKGKKQIADHLKTKEGDGFEWTSLVTGPFLDWVRYGSIFRLSLFVGG